MSDEERIRKLVEKAELDMKTDDRKKATQKLFQALKMAKQTQNKEFLNKISQRLSDAWMNGETGYFFLNPQSIELSPIETDGLILDIGGGGEGIIGKLNGQQVVAIDISKRELEETRNAALKVVMDATDLKFLRNSFDVCTALFSLMYVPKKKHLRVFKEAYRVLKDNGRFLIWDIKVRKLDKNYDKSLAFLEFQLPNEKIETGYGVKLQTQDGEHFKKLAQKAKFKIGKEWSKEETLHLQLYKSE